MSHDPTERTKLGPGFDVYGVETDINQGYPNDLEMEDTASSPVQVVGEVVPESDVPSLGLTPTDPLSAENLREVTGPRTAATRNPSDAGSESIGNVISVVNVAGPAASGSQVFGGGQYSLEPGDTSRQARAKSPFGRTRRELSPRTRTAELKARMAKVRQTRITRYLPGPEPPASSAVVPLDTVTRAEADAALGELQERIGDAVQRTDRLVQAVAETHQQAQAAGQIAVSGAASVAQTNAGLEQMVVELRHELQQMRAKIDGAEERAVRAQHIADTAEQRAKEAHHAANVAEQHATAAQGNADAAQAKQQLLEQELRNADLAFQEERKTRMQEIATAQLKIGHLSNELQNANTRLEAQNVIVQDVAGIGGELREAKKGMEEQMVEMREMGEMTDQMMGHVEDLTTAFKQIDAELNVEPKIVKSAPVHVQGTSSNVKEPAGHVQTEPSSVINLVSGESEEERQPVTGQDYIKKLVDEQYRKIKEDIRLGKQPTNEPNPKSTAAGSSTSPMTSAGLPPLSPGQHLSHENDFYADPFSQNAVQIGDFPPDTTFHPRNVEREAVNRPSQATPSENREPRVVVKTPPQLPSGTQRAIENIVQAHLDQLGINVRTPQAKEDVRGSMAGSIPNPGPENPQFSFPILQGGATSAAPSQPVFATAQWRPKEPPAFTGNANDDVYLWTSLLRQYFVFMNGTARQEVAFAATLLRGAAHEWYMGYERRNGNQPPRDWPTMMQAILDRFGSNIRSQEAQARLLTISQGKRSVREYTSEFETLLGRMSTRDEATWKNMYVWGLQPHLARAVALKYPTTIAQAAGHAEETELAIKASQRPTLGGQGARTATVISGRGGSQTGGPRIFGQNRGRNNAGNQRGGRGTGGRRGGGWSRGRQGGVSTQGRTGVQCYTCGQYGHYSAQCPRSASTSGSNASAQSVNQRSNFAQARGGSRGARGGFRGNRRGNGGRRARFSGLQVVYDEEGYEYQVDDDGNIVLDFDPEDNAATSQQNEQNSGN